MTTTNATISMAVTALFASAVGRDVIAAAKDGQGEVSYKVTKLDDQFGTMKNGEKAPYVILTRADNSALVLKMHPEAAKRLFKKGTDSGLTVQEVAGTPPAGEQAGLQEELAQELAGAAVEEVKPEVKAAPAPKAPSKKEQTVAMFAEMTAKGLPRKDIIARMKSELGLSVPGANTYYQNCKSGAWK